MEFASLRSDLNAFSWLRFLKDAYAYIIEPRTNTIESYAIKMLHEKFTIASKNDTLYLPIQHFVLDSLHLYHADCGNVKKSGF